MPKCGICNKPIKERDYCVRLVRGMFKAKRLTYHWPCYNKQKNNLGKQS